MRWITTGWFGPAAAAAGVLWAACLGAGEPVLKGYADYDAYRKELESLVKPELSAMKSLGRTLGGREVYVLEIGSGKREEHPAILVVGGVHPPHLMGSELAVRLARRLVEQAGSDKAVAQMFAATTFYIIPRPSPDACEAFFRKPYYERTGNERPTDDDRDGVVDEDGPDDLNGDGFITMMRVEDPAGEYMADPADPRIVVKADAKKNQRGRWSLYSEGRDDDHDGLFNEDPRGGGEFNRNFPFNYPYFERGAGPHQVSEVESRAVANFAFDHPNIAIVFSFTPEDNLMRPWRPEPQTESQRIKTHLLSADAGYFNYVGEQYRELHGGKGAPEPPEGHGSLSQWAYFQYGRWSFGCRGWWIPPVAGEDTPEKPKSPLAEEKPEAPRGKKPPGAKTAEDRRGAEERRAAEDRRAAEERRALQWFDREKIDGFVPWKQISHPDFPGRTVEVGGIKPFLMLNPPAAELDPLAEKHWRFLCRLAELLPKLSIEEAKVEPLGEGVWRVTIAVVNQGYLPSAPEMGRITGEPHPLQAAIDLPRDASLLTGTPRGTLPVLAGNGGKAEKTWLVRAVSAKEFTAEVRVWSPSVGSVAQKITVRTENPKP